MLRFKAILKNLTSSNRSSLTCWMILFLSSASLLHAQANTANLTLMAKDAAGAALTAAKPTDGLGQSTVPAKVQNFQAPEQEGVLMARVNDLLLSSAEVSETMESRRTIDSPPNGRQFLPFAQLGEGAIKSHNPNSLFEQAIKFSGDSSASFSFLGDVRGVKVFVKGTQKRFNLPLAVAFRPIFHAHAGR